MFAKTFMWGVLIIFSVTTRFIFTVFATLEKEWYLLLGCILLVGVDSGVDLLGGPCAPKEEEEEEERYGVLYQEG